jgi:hypothetical protein
VARSVCSRCTEVLGISHQRSCPRQRDPVVDAFIALVLKQRREYVSEVRMTKKGEEVQRVDWEGVVAHQNR